MEQKPIAKKCATFSPDRPGTRGPLPPLFSRKIVIIDSEPFGAPPSETISFAQSGSVIRSRGHVLYLVRPDQARFFVDECGDTIMLLPEFRESPHPNDDRRNFLKHLLK